MNHPGIAIVGLAEADEKHIRSLVGAAIKARALRYTWVSRDWAHADLIVTTALAWEHVGARRTTDKEGLPMIAVLAEERDAVPRGTTKLQSPVRLEPFTVLMSVVERRLDKTSEVAKAAGPAPGESTIAKDLGKSPLVRLAGLIREGAHSERNSAWRVFGLGRHPLFISPAAKQFHCEDDVDSLAVGASSTIAIEPVVLEQVPDLPAERPLALLQWQVGLMASEIGLLPWIKPDAAMKLRRYPHLLALRQAAVHRRIAAVLSMPCLNVQHICGMTGVDARIVTGFVNAASMCGYLTEVEASAAPKKSAAVAAAPAPSPRRSLFASFRKALGISSS